MRRFIVTCGVACGIVGFAAGIGVLAGKGVTMSEIASDAAALDKMTKVERPAGKVDKWGGGVVPDLTKLGGPPKRVGIVTFFIKAHPQSEIDQTTSRGFYNDTTYTTKTTYRLTRDGANRYATAFMEQGLDDLRAAFAERGMTLLTPAEFLDTDEKWKFYNEFEYEISKIARLALRVGGGGSDFANADLASAAGTRFIPATLATGDYKSNKSMGELATGLGLDAILAVENEMKMTRSDLSLSKIQLVLYGPNPVPKVEGRIYPGWSYNTGMVYGGSVLQLKRPAEVATFEVKKKEMTTTGESFDGYAPLLKVAAVKLAADVAARAAGGE